MTRKISDAEMERLPSFPVHLPDSGQAVVKVINHLDDEVMKVAGV